MSAFFLLLVKFLAPSVSAGRRAVVDARRSEYSRERDRLASNLDHIESETLRPRFPSKFRRPAVAGLGGYETEGTDAATACRSADVSAPYAARSDTGRVCIYLRRPGQGRLLFAHHRRPAHHDTDHAKRSTTPGGAARPVFPRPRDASECPTARPQSTNRKG